MSVQAAARPWHARAARQQTAPCAARAKARIRRHLPHARHLHRLCLLHGDRAPRALGRAARPARRARRASSGPRAAGRGRAGGALAPAVRRRALRRPGWTAGGAFGAGRRRLAGRADAAAAPVVPCGERRRNALLRRSQTAAFAPAGQLQQLRARGHAWRQRALPARRRSAGREVQQRALAALARTSTWGAACRRRGGTW